MAESPVVSYAPNREDVVLSRALRIVANGRYVDLGSTDPVEGSTTYGFYERGWSGVVVAPDRAAATVHEGDRPRDTVVVAEAGVTTGDGLDDVLADAGWAGLDVHLLVMHTGMAGDEAWPTAVDVARWRPWVVVVESGVPRELPAPGGVEPPAWETPLLDADYAFCLDNGLSRFYVSGERAAELRSRLSMPANPGDHYVLAEVRRLVQERDDAVAAMREHDADAEASIVQWRAAALSGWASGSGAMSSGRESELQHQIGQHVNHIVMVDEQLRLERDRVAALHRTLSWRITKPLRLVRRGLPRRSG